MFSRAFFPIYCHSVIVLSLQRFCLFSFPLLQFNVAVNAFFVLLAVGDFCLSYQWYFQTISKTCTADYTSSQTKKPFRFHVSCNCILPHRFLRADRCGWIFMWKSLNDNRSVKILFTLISVVEFFMFLFHHWFYLISVICFILHGSFAKFTCAV